MPSSELYKTLYYNFGFPVILLSSIVNGNECSCGSSLCRSPGKHPQFKWVKKDILKEKSIKKEEFDTWFDTMKKFHNFGIKTGKSISESLVVIDFDDVEKEKDFIEKLKTTQTCEVSTGKGIHFYFYSDLKSKIKPLDRGFDVICNGRYVVGPDSIHSSGKHYEWNKVLPINMPKWVYDELKVILNDSKNETNQFDFSEKNTKIKDIDIDKKRKIPLGRRNETLFKQLMIFAKDKNKSLKDIKEQALLIRKRMEDPESFPITEVENVCMSVMGYKLKKKINIQNEFSLKEASEIWAKKLTNLGIIPNELQELFFAAVFHNMENFLIENSMIKEPLTETFTGIQVKDFIDYRSSIMSKAFEGVPVWNYVNNAVQNWTKVFTALKLEKRRYVGAKYTKGMKERRKTGFGVRLRNPEEMIKLFQKYFEAEIQKLLRHALTPIGKIKKFNYETDKKIFDYYEINIKEPKKNIVNFSSVSISIAEILDSGGLLCETGVTTLAYAPSTDNPTTRKIQMTDTSEEKKQTSKEIFDSKFEKVKTLEVKKEYHTLHYKKYGGKGNLLYHEADMLYKFDFSQDPKGLLRDKEKVLTLLETFKKGDVIGLGTNTCVFDSIESDDEEIVVYEKYNLKDRVPSEMESKKFIPFSLINKYIDMEFVDILYRDGELYGVDEKERSVKYEIFEPKKVETETEAKS